VINDLSPDRTAGLLLMAVLVYGVLIVNSFYSDDSPIQFRCSAGNAYTTSQLLQRGLRLEGDCRLVLR